MSSDNTPPLLGGKTMKAIQLHGKIYVEEPDVRAAVNAALATNEARNKRIVELEEQVRALSQGSHIEYPEASALRNLADRFESPVESNMLRLAASQIDLLHATLNRSEKARREGAEYAEQRLSDLKEMEARKDGAYEERNRVVAALAFMAIWAGWKAGIARTAIEGWSDDWHGCVCIDFPNGQASWHYHDSHAHLFEGLPPYHGKWDGHTTPEKYERLAHVAEVLREGAEWERETSGKPRQAWYCECGHHNYGWDDHCWKCGDKRTEPGRARSSNE